MKPKKSQGGLMDLFVGQGHPRPGDRVTKSQRRVLKNKKNLFGDWDGDGVINGLDCSPRNRNKHMVKLYTWHDPNDKENPYHAHDTDLRNQDYGRSTGMTGTGIYAYKSKQKALQEAEGSSLYKNRELYSIETDHPKVFKDSRRFNKFNRASKLHNVATKNHNQEVLREAQMNYKKAGIHVTMKELRAASKLASAQNEEQPVNFLMKNKGYDAVVADDENDQYRFGSVVLGKTGDFKDKLKDPKEENYPWNSHQEKTSRRRIGNHYDKTTHALIRTRRRNRSLEDIEKEAYSDKYENPLRRQKLLNRARARLIQEAKNLETESWNYRKKGKEQMADSTLTMSIYSEQDAREMSPNPRKYQNTEQYSNKATQKFRDMNNAPLKVVRDEY